MALKRTPVERPDGAELLRRIAGEASEPAGGIPEDSGGRRAGDGDRRDAEFGSSLSDSGGRREGGGDRRESPADNPSNEEIARVLGALVNGTNPPNAELLRQIEVLSPKLPTTIPQAVKVPSPRPVVASSATEQINFRGSPELARILARLAAEQGSIRLVIATLLENAGHLVPEVDLQPPPGRRRL